MLLFKTKCPSLHLSVHQSCHLNYGALNVSLHVRESGFRNLGNFCFWNPESSIGHGGMRTFYVFGIFYIGIWPWPWDHAFNCQFNWQLHSYTTPESWKYLLVDSGIQGFGMRNTNHGIGNLTIDWNPVSLFQWRRIRNPAPWIRNPRGGIRNHDCLGFSYFGRNVSSTDSCHLFLSNVSVFGF